MLGGVFGFRRSAEESLAVLRVASLPGGFSLRGVIPISYSDEQRITKVNILTTFDFPALPTQIRSGRGVELPISLRASFAVAGPVAVAPTCSRSGDAEDTDEEIPRASPSGTGFHRRVANTSGIEKERGGSPE